MRTWVLWVSSFALAADAAAQTVPAQEPRSTAPARSGSEAPGSVRHPTPDRNQFSPGAMPIQIEGAGLALPTGVDRDSPYSPPVPVPVAPKPPATEK